MFPPKMYKKECNKQTYSCVKYNFNASLYCYFVNDGGDNIIVITLEVIFFQLSFIYNIYTSILHVTSMLASDPYPNRL